MIWIRADANERIGSGHVMRCLSVAAALKARGEEVLFLVADEKSGRLLRQQDQAYVVLETAYTEMETELEILAKRCLSEKPSAILVDSYQATGTYLASLRQLVKIAYLDDIPRFAYPVDMVINYNIYGGLLGYEENTAGKDTRFLLGPAYAPLRQQFIGLEYTPASRAEHVLLTTGGADKYNLAELLLREFLGRDSLREKTYHVVSGSLNPNYPALVKLADEYANICLYQGVTDMAGLMKKCDVAVSAAGSTMYELSAIGVPTLCFSFVDNQELIVKTFYEKGLVPYGGSYQIERESFGTNVAEALEELLEKEQARRLYSERMRGLVDGRGADRVAEALINLGAEETR